MNYNESVLNSKCVVGATDTIYVSYATKFIHYA